jgi:class 3 adenylate cyclase/tetratricopeptide (TPR) repeat protein
MAVCLNCGFENPEEFKFCGACAAPLTPKRAPAHGARKTVTIMFCDLVGSTALGERLDSESLREVTDRYFAAMRSVIEHHGGIVEKFIGDAVMAIFGLPRAHEDDPLRAVRAAAEMREKLRSLNNELAEQWGVTLANRTGINTGEVVVGDPVSGQRLASGDAINVAARLEQSSGTGEILIGDATHRLVHGAVVLDEVDSLSLKGKTDRVRAFKVVRVLSDVDSLPRGLDSPLVGREAEISLMENAFERAVAGQRCELVTLAGEPGVGKSRLTRELLARLTGRARGLQGRCLSYGEGITFWTVAEVIKQAAGITDDAPVDVAFSTLSSSLPPHEAQMITERLSALVGLTSRTFAVEESFWAVRKALVALAQKKPLAIVFEDVHWGEPSFLDFIGQLSESREQAAILVVCTARPEFFEDHPAWMQGRTNHATVELTGLSTADSRSLIGNFGAGKKLAMETQDAIIHAAQGNPLFVEQIASMLIDVNDLDGEDGVRGKGNGPATITVPLTLAGLLSARLDSLSLEERAVIGAASVVGEVFYKGALDDLCDQEHRPSIQRCLTSLTQKRLVRPETSTFADEQAFAFRHLLIRDAAYREMLKGTRADLHQQFASWLERRVADRIVEYEEMVGFHLEQAFRLRSELAPTDEPTQALAIKAARLLASAGYRAVARSDNRASAVLLGRAAELFGDDSAGIELLPDLGSARWETGDFAGARAAFERAIENADSCGNKGVAARALIARSIMLDDGYADARRKVAATIPVLTELGDELGLARAWNKLGIFSFWEGRLAEGENELQRSMAHGQAAGDRAVLNANLIALMAATVYGPTPVDEALERLRDFLNAAPGEIAVEAFILGGIAELMAMKGQFEEARTASFQSRTMLQDLGFNVFAAAASQEDGHIEMLAGAHAKAEAELRKGYDALGEMGEAGFRCTIAALLSHALCALERWDEALRVTEFVEGTAEADDVSAQIRWRGARAKILAHRGSCDEAGELAREAVNMAVGTDYLTDHGEAALDLAQVLRACNKNDESLSVYEDAIRLFEQKGDVVSARKARALMASLSG